MQENKCLSYKFTENELINISKNTLAEGVYADEITYYYDSQAYKRSIHIYDNFINSGALLKYEFIDY